MNKLNSIFGVIAIWTLLPGALCAQTAITMTNPQADSVLHGDYDPASYQATVVINHPDSILDQLLDRVSEDSLRAYLESLQSFRTRNTGSDTVSNTMGMGAARRWCHQKFVEFSAENESRLHLLTIGFRFAMAISK